MSDDKEKKQIDSKLESFSDLLTSIQNLDPKQRKLYLEIYENAITDRFNAETLLITLTAIAGAQSTEHAIHGKNMASYIERMTRSNEQLLKLAEIITRINNNEDNFDPEKLFEQIKSNKK
jgi:hypothetical protein